MSSLPHAIAQTTTTVARGRVLAALVLHTVVSSGTHVVAKQATGAMAWPMLATLRLMASGLVFAAILALVPTSRETPGGLARRRWPPRRLWGRIMVCGLFAGPLNQGFFLAGVNASHATHAGLLYALTPIGVYLASVWLGREQPRAARLVGAAVALLGVVVLLAGGWLLGGGLVVGANTGGLGLGTLAGDLLIVVAVVAWVVWTLEARQLAAEFGGLQIAGWALIAGALWSLPIAPFTIDFNALQSAGAGAWALLGYLVLMTSVLAYILWNFALARAEASQVAVFANLQPVGTALLSALFLVEPLGWPVWAGGLLVLLGVRVAQRR